MIKKIILIALMGFIGNSVFAEECKWIADIEKTNVKVKKVSKKRYARSSVKRPEYDVLHHKLELYNSCIENNFAKLRSELSDVASMNVTLETKNKSLSRQLTMLIATEKKHKVELLTLNKMVRKNGKLSKQSYDGLSKSLSEINSVITDSIDSTNKLLAETNNVTLINARQLKDLSVALELEIAKISKKISNINKEQENSQNYSLLAFLLVFLTVFLVLLFLRKSILNQKDELVEKLKSIREELDKDYVHLDNKLIELIESIASSLEKKSNGSEASVNHSLALKVADEIVRIQKNTLRMDTKTKGLKQLIASVKRIQDNFSSNGYDIVEMLNQPYDEGMKVTANFVPDDNLDENEQVITRIIKPQVNYQGIMIQAAQIEVSIGG